MRVLDLGRLDGPLLVFGGVYGNLQAFEALLAEARHRGFTADRMIHTGDVVAYGADAARSAELLRETGCQAIKGNVEEQLGIGAGDCGCGFEEGSSCDQLSAAWYAYAARHVGAELRRWMADMPDQITFTLGGVSFRVVHGTPGVVNEFVYGPEPTEKFRAELDAAATDAVIAGHSGFPFARAIGDRHWINSGALGLPANDGTTRVWYAVLRGTADGAAVDFRSLHYDHREAARRLLAAGLPQPYAEAIRGGRVPNHDTLPEPLKSMAGIPIAETTHAIPRRGSIAA